MRELGQQMGERYRDAVQVCLSGELEFYFPDEFREERVGAYLHHVRSKVVDEIAICDAQYILSESDERMKD